MRHFALALLSSLLSAAYWWIVFTFVYAEVLFGGDRRAATMPTPERDVLVRNVSVIVGGVLIHAVAAMLWRRFIRRSRR